MRPLFDNQAHYGSNLDAPHRSATCPTLSMERPKQCIVPFDSQAHCQPIFGTPDRYLSCPTVSLNATSSLTTNSIINPRWMYRSACQARLLSFQVLVLQASTLSIEVGYFRLLLEWSVGIYGTLKAM
ncbi:hypothetical protein IV203_000062 [Nitzschia inconspicua]|uniref:Uncharacterized protein n=1 Tax=Nitzschia inconspicua TaxID=303405 RepID=A0A9K3PQC0_9STRA|nr:hypothetical protein IV203_000062 [Nitzschia inconspicua]